MILDHEAIRKAYPDAIMIDDSLGAFKADGSKITLVQSDIDAARVELNKLNYKHDRVLGVGSTTGYPAIQTQLDQLYHDMKNGTLNTSGEWYVGITSVKTAFPKSS